MYRVILMYRLLVMGLHVLPHQEVMFTGLNIDAAKQRQLLGLVNPAAMAIQKFIQQLKFTRSHKWILIIALTI